MFYRDAHVSIRIIFIRYQYVMLLFLYFFFLLLLLLLRNFYVKLMRILKAKTYSFYKNRFGREAVKNEITNYYKMMHDHVIMLSSLDEATINAARLRALLVHSQCELIRTRESRQENSTSLVDFAGIELQEW